MKKRDIYFGLDLDETLMTSVRVWGASDIPDDAEFYIFEDKKITYGVYLRNDVHDFLKFIDTHFNLFFYTRSMDFYAEQIVKNLGYEDKPLFHRDHTNVIKYKEYGAYNKEVEKTYFQKDLGKIATLLNTTIDNIIFIDDVIDIKEITTPEIVIQIPEFNDDNVKDYDLKIIKDHIEYFAHVENNKKFIENVTSLKFEIPLQEKVIIKREDKKRIRLNNC